MRSERTENQQRGHCGAAVDFHEQRGNFPPLVVFDLSLSVEPRGASQEKKAETDVNGSLKGAAWTEGGALHSCEGKGIGGISSAPHRIDVKRQDALPDRAFMRSNANTSVGDA